MKRTIEVEDVLQERIESAIEDVKEALSEYLAENEPDDMPDLSDLDYSGRIHEIIDSSVPIYTRHIDTIMFLYGSEVERAFDDAGIGSRDDEWPSGWQAAAICCYIEQQVYEWWSENAENIFEEWKEAREFENNETEEE